MIDLVDEVVDHVACKRELSILEQSHLDEVTVPAVHFVEPSARNDVRAGQIQESVLFDAREVRRERLQVNGAELLLIQNLLYAARNARAILTPGDVDGPGSARRSVQLRVLCRGRKVAIGA